MNKILLIGDSCLDVFVYGECNRLCPEAPVPVFNPKYKYKNDGMALNVYNNLISLGCDVDIITNNEKPIKTRYIDEISNQMLLRIDENDIISENLTIDKINSIELNKYKVIAISDYNKGFLNEKTIEYIANNHNLVFLDSKKKFDKWCNNVNFVKINKYEFQLNYDYLKNVFKNDFIITNGKYGAILNDIEIFSIENKYEVRDVSGAGDTFFAGLIYYYINSNNIRESIKFANKCASNVVTKRGVSIVNINEI